MKEITPQPGLEKHSTVHSDKKSNPSQRVRAKEKVLNRFWQGNGGIERTGPMGCEEVPSDVGSQKQNLSRLARKYI
jgi:hypothetical protein